MNKEISTSLEYFAGIGILIFIYFALDSLLYIAMH